MCVPRTYTLPNYLVSLWSWIIAHHLPVFPHLWKLGAWTHIPILHPRPKLRCFLCHVIKQRRPGYAYCCFDQRRGLRLGMNFCRVRALHAPWVPLLPGFYLVLAWGGTCAGGGSGGGGKLEAGHLEWVGVSVGEDCKMRGVGGVRVFLGKWKMYFFSSKKKKMCSSHQ